MANNILEHLASLSVKDPKRANWNLDYDVAGTNDFGFGKVRLCEEIIAGSHIELDFRSAYSTNPTISPVLSRAKVRVTAIWIPMSLYIPALRDGVEVRPGKTDYSFPTVNFNYSKIQQDYLSALQDYERPNIPVYSYAPKRAMKDFGAGLPYCPMGSIFAELGMWQPNFQPVSRVSHIANSPFDNSAFPSAKNAIPLLGYYDFYRHYVLNNQDSFDVPIRVRPFIPERTITAPVVSAPDNPVTFTLPAQPASDNIVSRGTFDILFKRVRTLGSNYPISGFPFDISGEIGSLLYNQPAGNLFPNKYIANAGILTWDESFYEENPGYLPPEYAVAYPYNHFGEWRDTYGGDYYTAYLSNENVSYERSTARVQADDGGVITMEQIYSASRVQNYIRRSVFKNNGYGDFIESQYGVVPPTNLTHPLFLGSVTTMLSWNDVISQAQSGSDDDIEANEALGSRAALGFGRMVTGKFRGKKDRPFVSFTAKEPGYLMLIETIIPEVSYYLGYKPMYDKVSLEDLYFPAFDRSGYQDKQFQYLAEDYPYLLGQLPNSVRHSNWNKAYAQEPAYMEFMARSNRLQGQMADTTAYLPWSFARGLRLDSGYDIDGSPIASVVDAWCDKQTHTYVCPEDHNQIFTNNQGVDNFQCYYAFDFRAYQPLSHRFLSWK